MEAQSFLAQAWPAIKHRDGSPDIHDFEDRLFSHFPAIQSRFEQLYGHRNDCEDQLKSLISLLLSNYLNRPEALKNLDKERQANPGWFRSENLTGMQLYVDRFNKDLNGLTQKIDYLKELDINLIHIMPVLKSPKVKSDGGYAVSDYRNIDERFGSNEDFDKVVQALKKENMVLLLDLVINHTSDEHEWAMKAKQGQKEFQEYYYTYSDKTIPDQFEETMPEIFPETAPGNFTYNEDLGQWVMTVFNTYQWDLNFTNPKVLAEMIDVILHLANKGVDIFRMDAVAFVWKQLGTASQNLPEAHILHQLIKLCTQIAAPGVAFLAEAIVAPEEIVKYFGESETISNEYDIAYNATLMALLWNSISLQNARVIRVALKRFPPKPSGTTWINYIRCHDDIGLGYGDQYIADAGLTPFLHRKFMTRFLTGKYTGSFSKGLPFMYDPEKEDARISGTLASLCGLESGTLQNDPKAIQKAIDRINMLHAIVLSYGGIPMIYYGDEMASLNDYSFMDDPAKQDDNRWMHRPIIDWEKAELRKKKGTPEHEVFGRLQKMIQVRKRTPEFEDDNDFKLLDTGNDETLAFLRSKGNSSTLVIANFKDKAQELYAHVVFPQTKLNHNQLVDKISDKAVEINLGKIIIAPFQCLWLTNN